MRPLPRPATAGEASTSRGLPRWAGLLRDTQTGEFALWLAVPHEDGLPTNRSWFSRDGRTLYGVTSVDANAGRLLAVDVASGGQTVLAEDPAYDVRDVECDPLTWRPQAVVYLKERQEWAFLDPEWLANPETDKDMLVERSPLFAADQIRIPVLVAHGANDVRVRQAEAEQIVAALGANGVPHEYLLFDDEGHGLARQENRERFFAAAERFLAEQLGGRMEP